MLNFSNVNFVYEPYPVGVTSEVLDSDFYRLLLESYPPLSIFKRFNESLGDKYSLSESNNRKEYFQYLHQNDDWRKFYSYVKSKKFVEFVLDFFLQQNIDLGINSFDYVKSIKNKRRGVIRRLLNRKTIRSRFEFSAMPAFGGCLKPHTDAPTKLITLVLAFNDNQWNHKKWGGGTSIDKPVDVQQTFNQLNKFQEFDFVETVEEFPFRPNQCVMFVKTYNSWHSVKPMNGPQGQFRRTVTINIEEIL